MKKQYLECGKIVSTHGIKGEVRVQPWCDTPEYLCAFRTVYLQKGQASFTVEQARINKQMVLLKLSGINTLEEAVTLRGSIVYINREDEPAAAVQDGVFFVQDLIGLTVLDADTGREWGRLTDVFATGANDVYELTDAAGVKRLLPAIRQVVLETDITAGRMLIRPLEGLFENEVNGDAD